ncbi:MAG: DUF2155 domain-containing protein [Pseudomonadota bacterium]
MLALVLALTAAMQQSEPPREILGWTIEPPAPARDAELTELDRLSQSSSGAGFAAGFYGFSGEDLRQPVSVTLRALNKVTAQFADLEVPIGEPKDFGTLTVLPRTCSTRPPEEFPETTVFLEVYSGENDIAGRRALGVREDMDQPELIPISFDGEVDVTALGEPLFTGWMFASTPSLNALEHPTYDVWVIDCKMIEPDV